MEKKFKKNLDTELTMSEQKLPIIVVCSEGVKRSQEIIDSK